MMRREIALDSEMEPRGGGYWSEAPHPKIEIKKTFCRHDDMRGFARFTL
jgi:hypothetical protein